MKALVDPPAYGSPEWLAWRRRGLGASDLPSIVGCSPWRGEFELALDKRGETEPRQSWATRLGHILEGPALDWYGETTGAAVVRGETWTDPRWPHLWATLDGRAGRVGVEIKVTSRWRTPPDAVRIQALAQMGLAGLESVDVVRVSGTSEPEVFGIERDDALITELLDTAEAWWARYGEGDELPPPDGSRAAMRHLDGLRGEGEAQATAEQATLMGALRACRRQAKELEAQDGAIVAALKASMAGTGVLSGDGFRVTWSATKGRTSVDWQGVAMVMRAMGGIAPEVYDARVAEKTTVGTPGTVFRPIWMEETE